VNPFIFRHHGGFVSLSGKLGTLPTFLLNEMQPESEVTAWKTGTTGKTREVSLVFLVFSQ